MVDGEPFHCGVSLSRLKLAIMRKFLLLLLVCSYSSFAEEEWVPPLPPGSEAEACREKEIRSDPVASYRIAPNCSITDIASVGNYQYGMGEVKKEIRRFQTSEVVRRYLGGHFRYYKKISIELHKALENTATLVCHVDMMGKKVLDASIIRMEFVDNENLKPVEQPLALEKDGLPDMGVFTHTKTVTHLTNRCR